MRLGWVGCRYRINNQWRKLMRLAKVESLRKVEPTLQPALTPYGLTRRSEYREYSSD